MRHHSVIASGWLRSDFQVLVINHDRDGGATVGRNDNQILSNTFVLSPEETPNIDTRYRRICTRLPAPETVPDLRRAASLFPEVNCYQPPVIWDSADGFTIKDRAGNQWIDFTSTAVMTNTGHGHPAIREAVKNHVDNGGLMGQFSFASDIRIELAERLIGMAPEHCKKVYFWTVGSEAIECALRLAREVGLNHHPDKYHVLTHEADYHGWTLGAHQMSGTSASKPWLATPDSAIHHIPFPGRNDGRSVDFDWSKFIEKNVSQLAEQGITAEKVCAVFIETMQGWGAVPLPTSYVKALRAWADANNVLLVFDEVQTGFARTGKMFAHEHYDVRADLICIGKGLTSTLPLAAVLGPADILDLLPPAEITTTHAAHPVSCAAALANLDVINDENLIAESARKGDIAEAALRKLQERFPDVVSDIAGFGLLRGIHICDPKTGELSRELARDWTWAAVKHGVMLFQVNRPSIKVCPPLIIDDDAIVEGVEALGDALETVLS
jgi:4-aminobutyrate aminotransferase/diaminobutyrate-pyruvate transaminase/4-aminobutyrate aminotransferase/(S)-3-amino-2-methylpropionate transaminase